MWKHILCGLQLRRSKMRFPCHERNLQCAVLHFSSYKLQESRRMPCWSYASPRAITKNIPFCFKAAGLQSISSASESGLCLRMTKTSTSGGKKFEKLSKSHQFHATVELLIAFRCLPLNAQWLCHQKEGKSDLCRCWHCRRPEWSWDGLE